MKQLTVMRQASIHSKILVNLGLRTVKSLSFDTKSTPIYGFLAVLPQELSDNVAFV
jgi:hypothetical protein